MQKMMNLKKPEWVAWLSALVCGFGAHLFALANILHNYDNILQQPKGYGAGITSGRWLLTLLGDFSEDVLDLGYNLGTVNGIVFLALIALSAAFLVNTLSIRSHVGAALTGCLMATFPTVCASMVFRYTIPYYGISLLLAVLAAWVADKKSWGVVLSALCLACSMGIYQAYPPFTIGMFLLILMREALKEEAQLKNLILRGVRYCVCLILGVIGYFVFLKLSMALLSGEQEVVLDTYQGIDTMGKISLSELPWLVKKAWLSAALFSVQDYCGIAATRVLKLLWSALVLGILGIAAVLMVQKRKRLLNCLFFCLMGLLFPLAVNFIVIMAPSGIVYTIMVYSFVLIGCAPLMLMECLPDGKLTEVLRKGVIAAAVLIVFYNGYYSNLNYTRLYYANRQVENYFSGMAAQARMTEGYTPDKKLAVLGDQIDDPNFWEQWQGEPTYGGFAGSHARGLLNTSYSVDFWVSTYIGLGPTRAQPHEIEMLTERPEVQQMPCWPSEGSMNVVDDYLVIKLQEP